MGSLKENSVVRETQEILRNSTLDETPDATTRSLNEDEDKKKKKKKKEEKEYEDEVGGKGGGDRDRNGRV
ncbi:hypothetical protein M0804_009169 [Polistes exclamans]|nr:hypothetical protein M0804_009169 [Polistes exclamans]